MTVSLHNVCIDRIMAANEQSPIAVFKVQKFGDRKDCVFANTAASVRQIRDNKSYIGTFHRGNADVFKKLINYKR